MTEPETTPDPAASTGRRSPAPRYPAVDLRTAIARTVDLYRAAPNHPVPLPTAAELWGYSPKSSSAKVAAAALKQFGLVRDVGAGESRQLELTREGRELAFSDQDRDSSVWDEAIKDAALAPKLYSQVVDYFGYPLPDERVVLRHLIFDVGFPDESSAEEFVRRLNATMEFADFTVLDPGDLAAGPDQPRRPSPERPPLEPTDDDAGRSRERSPQDMAADIDPHGPPRRSVYDMFRADRQHVQIPLSNGEWAMLEAAFPLTEPQWEMLVSVLHAMKPALVAPDVPSPSDAQTDGPT